MRGRRKVGRRGGERARGSEREGAEGTGGTGGVALVWNWMADAGLE